MGDSSTTPATTRSRGRPVDPALHGRFLDAALELVAERGYRALTTAAVAARAGASTASLYRRWSTKRALVADIARTLTRDALGDIDTGSLADDLRTLIGRKQELFGSVGTTMLALLAEAGHDAELRDILREEVVEATATRLDAILGRAAERGEVVPAAGIARVLTLALVGGGLLEESLAPGEPRSRFVDEEVALLLRALAAA